MKHFDELNKEELEYLYEAILALDTKDDVERFLDDICTINEIKSISQRMQVAKMLRERKTYTEIANTTGASTATISRVNRCLNYGSRGYKLVFNKLYGDE
ncbi:MAG: YerC/YecD family TrpR-related protein [Clostridium sp.]|uniref:YerC/YecD family TrpR-related protein n=1 Tax=Clostridium sp. TaxID=1506 RepID=UPI002FCC32CC